MLVTPQLDVSLHHARALLRQPPAGGYARLLWQRVLIVVDDIADPVVPWLAAAAGATAHVVSLRDMTPARANAAENGLFRERVQDLIVAIGASTPRLNASVLGAVTDHNPFPEPSLHLSSAAVLADPAAEADQSEADDSPSLAAPTRHSAGRDNGSRPSPSSSAATTASRPKPDLDDDYNTVLVDGLGWVTSLDEAERVLRFLHDHARSGAIIECRARPGEAIEPQALDRVRAQAIGIGFGVRPDPTPPANGRMPGQAATESAAAKSSPPRPPSGSTEEATTLGLVRLSEPMRDFPEEGRHHAQIMGQVMARLDIAAALCRGREVLEAGCATGIGARRFVAAGAKRVIGLEICEQALSIGRSRMAEMPDAALRDAIELRQWDLNQTPLPLDDESIDLVVCLEVLEHTLAHEAIVAEFERVLRPGGMLLVSIPNREFETKWNRYHGFENPFHLRVSDAPALLRLLARFDDFRFLYQANITGTLVHEAPAPAEIRALAEASADNTPDDGPHQAARDARLVRRLAPDPPVLERGTFAVQDGWFRHTDGIEVMAVLATKPEWVEGANGRRRRRRVRSPRPRSGPLSSMLRVFEHGSNEPQYQIRMLLRRVEEELLAERFRIWSEQVAALDRLRATEQELALARRRFDEMCQAQNDAKREVAAALERAASELAAREQYARAMSDRLDAIHQNWMRIRSELTRSEAEAAFLREQLAGRRELRELQAAVTSLRDEAVRQLRDEVAGAREQIVALEAERDRLRAALSEHQVMRNAAEFDRVERRCLSIESRVYDVEDRVQALAREGARGIDSAPSTT